MKAGRCRAALFLFKKPFGGLAQLGEHLPYKQRVSGSSPLTSILVLEPLAQLVEHLTFNQRVAGSSPAWLMKFYFADVAELADALDLGSSASRRGGSSPSIRISVSLYNITPA